jgi:hypothetical protein
VGEGESEEQSATAHLEQEMFEEDLLDELENIIFD